MTPLICLKRWAAAALRPLANAQPNTLPFSSAFPRRFDGVVLDAKPWGVGQQVLSEAGGSATAAAGAAWPATPRSEAERNLALVEGRHPLALAHFANHPPPGVAPNVMVAAFDLRAPGESEAGALGPSRAALVAAVHGGFRLLAMEQWQQILKALGVSPGTCRHHRHHAQNFSPPLPALPRS